MGHRDAAAGRGQGRAVRQMFDAIAPRYDMVNRVMTFRLDVGWRRKAVRAARRWPPGRRCSTSPAAPATCAPSWPRAGPPAAGVDLCYGMLAADAPTRRAVQADILRLPLPDAAVDGGTCGFALRNLVDLPAFFAELGRVVRPGGRIALLDVGIPQNRLVRFGNGVYFGNVVPRIGALLSDGAAYRYLPKSVAYLPRAGGDDRPAAAPPGSATRSTIPLSGGITQLLVGTRR